MGKAGKAKKQRSKAAGSSFKCQHEVLAGAGDAHEDTDRGFDDGEAQSDSSSAKDILLSIGVLNILAHRHDLYESKAMKQLRTQLFPLIELQIRKGSHFEATASTDLAYDGDCSIGLQPCKLAALSRSAISFHNDHASFFSSDAKQFRASLHPLVQMQQRRMSNKPVSVAVPDATHSAKVSMAFRSRDWPMAFRELYSMHYSKEYPKLGLFINLYASAVSRLKIDFVNVKNPVHRCAAALGERV